MAEVVAVNISERKGIRKHEVPYIELLPHHGIVGDAHAGDWHRQVSLLAEESIDTMRALGLSLTAGLRGKHQYDRHFAQDASGRDAAPDRCRCPARDADRQGVSQRLRHQKDDRKMRHAD